MNSAGAARLADFQYGAAERAFTEAGRLAEGAGDFELAGAVAVNSATLHLQFGNLEGASEEARRAQFYRHKAPHSKYGAETAALFAKIQSAAHGLDAALPYFADALDQAERAGDVLLKARLLSQLGFEYLSEGRLAEAERAMVEAFRLRRLTGDRELAQSYRGLGLLRLAQGDLRSAATLLDSAVAEGKKHPGRVPLWASLHARGRLLLAQRDAAGALDQFRAAFSDARRWRLRVPAPEAPRLSAEAGLREVCSSLAETAAELHFRTGGQSFAREAFTAVEDCRASSFEPLAADSQDISRSVQATLGRSAALFSFHMAEPYSLRFVVTEDGLTLSRIPGRRELTDAAARYRDAVANATEAGGELGASLYAQMFGGVPARKLDKERWMIAAEGAIAEMPYAALTDDGGRRLIERHTVRLIPSASVEALRSTGSRTAAARFIGVADALYNVADPRFRGQAGGRRTADLPRLAASGREIRRCAEAWASGEPTLLEGAAACRHRLETELKRGAAVVHLATHVVRSAGISGRARIALSITPSGEPEYLESAEVGSWRLENSTLVTLSGCASGAQERRPRPYTLGLSPASVAKLVVPTQAVLARAWLAAGARAVAASLWPMPDDTGELFVSYYQHLRESGGADAAGALRAAQIEAINSNSWRSAPRFWAAYFVIAKG